MQALSLGGCLCLFEECRFDTYSCFCFVSLTEFEVLFFGFCLLKVFLDRSSKPVVLEQFQFWSPTRVPSWVPYQVLVLVTTWELHFTCCLVIVLQWRCSWKHPLGCTLCAPSLPKDLRDVAYIKTDHILPGDVVCVGKSSRRKLKIRSV